MACNGRGKQPSIPSEKEILFFKIILSTSLQDGKLKIPNKFTAKYGSDLLNPVFLKTPDGIQWKVYWTRHDDGGIFLQKGWKEFATYYSLSHGHLVIFKYKETCNLEVHICEASALEIDYLLCSQGPQARENLRTRSQGVDGQRSSNPPQNVQTRGPQSPKNLRTDWSGDVGQSSGLPQYVQTRDGVSQDPQPRKKLRTNSSGAIGQSSKLPLSQGPQPRKKLRTHAGGVVGQSSKLPQHVQTRGNMSQGPQPCKKLRTRSIRVVGQNSKLPQHVQEISGQSQEDRDGATEDLNRASTSKSEAPSFTVIMKPTYVKGYILMIPSRFAKKHLKEKDGEDFLFRVLDGGRTWFINYKLGRFGTGWKDFASDNNLNVGDVCLFELTKSRLAFEVTIIRVLGDVDLEGMPDLKCKIDVPLPAIQESSKFSSRHPFFKFIIKANREGDSRPRIPVALKRKYFDKKQTVVLQSANTSWQVHLVGTIPTKLSKGWHPFAKARNLQVGDVCIFELIHKADAVFNVHIFKGHP